MAVSSPVSNPQSPIEHIKRAIGKITLPWGITLGYLSLMLLLPVAAMLLKASTANPAEFWKIATSPIALSAYDVTFVTALIAALINGLFGTLIAWVWFNSRHSLQR